MLASITPASPALALGEAVYQRLNIGFECVGGIGVSGAFNFNYSPFVEGSGVNTTFGQTISSENVITDELTDALNAAIEEYKQTASF